MMKIVNFTIFIFLFTSVLSSNVLIAAEPLALTYADGRVSCARTTAAVADILEWLAQSAGLEVTLVEILAPDARMTIEFDNQPIDRVLKRILKGYNYAVVYNRPGSECAAIISYRMRPDSSAYAGNRVASANAVIPFAVRPDPSAPTKRERLADRIAHLQYRIESGISDTDYEKWASIRGAQFAVHDQDKLSRRLKELQQLDSD